MFKQMRQKRLEKQKEKQAEAEDKTTWYVKRDDAAKNQWYLVAGFSGINSGERGVATEILVQNQIRLLEEKEETQLSEHEFVFFDEQMTAVNLNNYLAARTFITNNNLFFNIENELIKTQKIKVESKPLIKITNIDATNEALNAQESDNKISYILALTALYKNKPFPAHVIVVGDVKENGEIAAVNNIAIKFKAALQGNFTRFIIPTANLKDLASIPVGDLEQLEVVGVSTFSDLYNMFFAQEATANATWTSVAEPAIKIGAQSNKAKRQSNLKHLMKLGEVLAEDKASTASSQTSQVVKRRQRRVSVGELKQLESALEQERLVEFQELKLEERPVANTAKRKAAPKVKRTNAIKSKTKPTTKL